MDLATLVCRCRSCGSSRLAPFLSLGMTPIANNLLSTHQLGEAEPLFPLGVAFCADCTLVQSYYEPPAGSLFNADYPYYSSFSDTVTRHGRAHAEALIADRGLDADSLVVEVASNDGYLLRRFVEAGVPVLGIDPAPGPAAQARRRGVPTLVEFFGADMAARLRAEGRPADVVVANNVMAHVPDLNDFVAGLATIVADDGVVTIENPYVRDLIEQGEFDTIYHEHFCYFSCAAVERLLRRHGLHLNRVEYFPHLHGGTLRWSAGRRPEPDESVAWYLDRERAAGMDGVGYYTAFSRRVVSIQRELVDLLSGLRRQGARIVAYGAAAKGATLLNATRVPHGVLDCALDRNPHKQGLHMPGVHLEIRDPAVLSEADPPDYVLLLAWNHATEIIAQLDAYRRRGGKFIVPIPKPQVV